MEALSSVDRLQLIGAALHSLPALMWAIVAHLAWRFCRVMRRQGTLVNLIRAVSTAFVLHYLLHTFMGLSSDGAGESKGALGLLADLTFLVTLPLLRHAVQWLPVRGRRPGRPWLLINYGLFALVASLLVLGHAAATPAAWLADVPRGIARGYSLLMLAVILWDIIRLRQDRARRPLLFDLRPPSAVFLVLAVVGHVVVHVVVPATGPSLSLTWLIAHTIVGLAWVVPLALAVLGQVLRRFAVGAVMLAGCGWIYFGARALARGQSDPGRALLIDVLGVLGIVVLLTGGRVLLRAGIERLVLRRSLRRSQALQQFLLNMAPERGLAECCRLAVEEVARSLKFRGTALLLSGPDLHASRGTIGIEVLRQAWPRGSDTDRLPERTFDLLWLQDAALQEAMHEAGATWVVPVDSPRRRWGHFFVAADPLGTAGGDLRLGVLEDFARDLALVLDGAELYEKASDVERQLAQAEKLASLGEMAARVAHEIRNPVTAARSLAQLLARDAGSELDAEHAALIIQELDRVELQIRSLLQFARRETYEFEPVELATLIRATLNDQRSRLDGDGVQIDLDLSADVVVRADRERLRQVLINLIENAVDAVRETRGPRKLTLSLVSVDGWAQLTVADTGGGVPAEALPKLFEPFFSLKSKGTGLGLAIAKRVVEAHEGRITARPGPERGLVFRVSLPVATAADGRGARKRASAA